LHITESVPHVHKTNGSKNVNNEYKLGDHQIKI